MGYTRHALQVASVIVIAASFWGCWGEATPTYNQAARTILHDKCATCHHQGGAGPMPLVTYDQAYAYRKAIADAVENGRMPPWLPAPGCNSYKNDLSLSADEKQMLLSWAKDGAPLGPEPATALPDFAPPKPALPRVDVEVTMPTAYKPTPSFADYDDFRCMLLDWPVAQTVYVRGFNAIPSDPKLLHHLIVYSVKPDEIAKYQALDDAEPGLGWTCYGGEGDLPSGGLIAGWQPGVPGGEFAGGIGVKVEPGSKLALNMHYNLLDTSSDSDQTTLQFMLGNSGSIGIPVPILDPGWLVGEFKIAAGDPDAVFSFKWEPTQFTGGLSLTVHSVAVHMHVLGERAKIEVVKEDGTRDCLLDIPKWNFYWSSGYVLKRPYKLQKGDKLYIECEFDNSAANQPVFNGKQIEPQDLTWGGIAPNEMCAGILMSTIGF